MGQSIFSNAWKNDIDFWQTCIDEWGQGPGYKIRVGNHNKEWFDNESRRLLGEEIKVLIGREWAQTLHNVSSLLEPLE